MGLVFAFDRGQDPTRTDVLAVDGVFGCGPNLSHWPGNRTPSRYRHDLSTGMALRLARDPDREEFLRGVTTVSNNHYDTDGFGSVLAVLQPDAALAVEDRLLDAALAGDFEVIRSWHALAFDEIVLNLGHHPRSPIVDRVAGLPDADRYEGCYLWLLAHGPDLLRDPSAQEELWIDAWREFERDLHLARAGIAVVEAHPREHVAVIRAPRPLGTRALTTLAEGTPRVVHVVRNADGCFVRCFHTTHSWFDSLTPVPRRFPWNALATRFQAAERAPGGASWVHHPMESPFAELSFGIPHAAPEFPFGTLCAPTPTSLDPEWVIDAVLDAARGDLIV